jgi:Right handed beta helix region
VLSREPVFYDQFGNTLLWERTRLHDSSQIILNLSSIAPLLTPQEAGMVFAAPKDGAGLPGFRKLDAKDLNAPGGTVNFLRSDGVWATPPGTGAISTDITVINQTDTSLVLASSSGADATLTAATATLAGLLSAANAVKLDGIAPGATANASDAFLLDRANHTGTQPASTISGLAPSATVDTTDAGNITSGTMAVARLPLFAGTTPGLVPTSLGGSILSPGHVLRSDGRWVSPLLGLSGTAPVVVTQGPDDGTGTAAISVRAATNDAAGVVKTASQAEVLALYSSGATPAPGAADKAVTLLAAQGGLMPLDLTTLNLAPSLQDADVFPLSRIGVQSGKALKMTALTLRNELLSIQLNGAGAIKRFIPDRLKEYCSFNDYLTLNQALAENNHIIIPPGDFLLTEEVQLPRDGITIEGAGARATRLICAPTMTGHGIFLRNRNDCTLRGFSIDGNAAGRGLTAKSALQNIIITGSRNLIEDVESLNAPEFGILLDGILIAPTYRTIVRGCFIRDNGGTGMALGRAGFTKIIGNIFQNNGYENLTIDIQSHGTIVMANHFFRHRGGCGNIGWDDSDVSQFIGNFIDSEHTTDPTEGDRNGICINSQVGTTAGSIIANNTILNCKDYGIILRDRTGQPPVAFPPGAIGSKPGDTLITGNYIRNSGKSDIRIEDSNELIDLGTNSYQTIDIQDPDLLNVRLTAGDAALETELAFGRHYFPANTYTKVNFSNVQASRHIRSDGAGGFYLPCGGFYSIDMKLRLDVVSEMVGAQWIQLRINTADGVKLINHEIRGGTAYTEPAASMVKALRPGLVFVEVLSEATSGRAIADSVPGGTGKENWLSIVLLG